MEHPTMFPELALDHCGKCGSNYSPFLPHCPCCAKVSGIGLIGVRQVKDEALAQIRREYE